MGIIERRQREKDELREKILDAARDLFVEEGYDNVSMRKVADAIEYSPTAIYGHFNDKRELMRELCRVDFMRLQHRFLETQKVADPVERLIALGRAYIRFAFDFPNHYRLMFMVRHMHEKTPDELAAEGRGNPDIDGYAFLRETVRQAIEQGRLRAHYDHVECVTQTLWAGVHGVASLQIAKGDDPWIDFAPVEQRIDTMCRGIIEGLVPEGTVHTLTETEADR